MSDIITYKNENGNLICSFSGRLDTGVADIVEDDLIDHIMVTGLPVVFDYKNVDFVSSAFLRVCIKAARVSPDMQITITNALSLIKEVYDMTGLSRIFKFENVIKEEE